MPETPAQQARVMKQWTAWFSKLGPAIVDPGNPWLFGLTLALDFGLGLGLYLANGAADGRLIWISLLPGLTATLRFNWVWALMVTTAFLVLQGVGEYHYLPLV